MCDANSAARGTCSAQVSGPRTRIAFKNRPALNLETSEVQDLYMVLRILHQNRCHVLKGFNFRVGMGVGES